MHQSLAIVMIKAQFTLSLPTTPTQHRDKTEEEVHDGKQEEELFL